MNLAGHSGEAWPDMDESALEFDCAGQSLIGVLSRPSDRSASRVGVLIVTGGPQYRVGSHRQFVLLARRLATHGHPVLRFDYRGMGDSTGVLRGFEHLEEDLRASIEAMQRELPELSGVVIWGLCDAASAALMYAATDPRVIGLVLLNPWVRSGQTQARVHLKHYYGRRLLQAEFWLALLAGRYDWRRSLADFVRSLRGAVRRPAAIGPAKPLSFMDRMVDGWERFHGPVLIILSGRDLTAREFEEQAQSDARWHQRFKRAAVLRFADADHTFSRAEWRAAVERATLDWLALTEFRRAA